MTYTLENYLMTLHTGQWFGWSDSKNKVYANLVIHDDTKSKPSESDCTAGVAALQAAYDGDAYKRTREDAYPKLKEQLDLLYHDMAANKGDKTGEWFKAVKAVKDATAKPS
jgi:hypothetical protein